MLSLLQDKGNYLARSPIDGINDALPGQLLSWVHLSSAAPSAAGQRFKLDAVEVPSVQFLAGS